MSGYNSNLLAVPLTPWLREIQFLLPVLLQMHGVWLGTGVIAVDSILNSWGFGREAAAQGINFLVLLLSFTLARFLTIPILEQVVFLILKKEFLKKAPKSQNQTAVYSKVSY